VYLVLSDGHKIIVKQNATSTDGGRSWEKTFSFSADGGKTWSNYPSIRADAWKWMMTYNLPPLGGQTMKQLVINGDGRGAHIKMDASMSRDSGKTWTPIGIVSESVNETVTGQRSTSDDPKRAGATSGGESFGSVRDIFVLGKSVYFATSDNGLWAAPEIGDWRQYSATDGLNDKVNAVFVR
jgi:hypothetical protein